MRWGRKKGFEMRKEKVTIKASGIDPLPPGSAIAGALALAMGRSLGVPLTWIAECENSTRIYYTAYRVQGAPVRVSQFFSAILVGHPNILRKHLSSLTIALPPSEASTEMLVAELRNAMEVVERFSHAFVAVCQVPPPVADSAMVVASSRKYPWSKHDGEAIPGRRIAMMLGRGSYGAVARAVDGREIEYESSNIPVFEYASAVLDEDLVTVIYVANVNTVSALVARHRALVLKKLSEVIEAERAETEEGERT